MRIVLSHSYNKENRYFLVEKKDEPLEKIFLRLSALLTMIFHLNSTFGLEEEEISKLLKKKFNFTCDFKPYEYNELWKKHKILDVNYSDFYNLLEEQSDENIYHVDLYCFWEIYFHNKRNFKRVYKELKNNEKFYKEIHEELILSLKSQYIKSYNLQLQELEENIRAFDIKNWFSFLN